MNAVSTRTLVLLISIHALREEGDLPRRILFRGKLNFYPRPPRGGRPCALARLRRGLTISIHALREEGDAPDRWNMAAT